VPNHPLRRRSRRLAVRARAAESAEPFTFVVAHDGFLRLAPRSSEHLTCAGGADVLAAGGLGFHRDYGAWMVREVSNQSTGYCPGRDSWHALARALDLAPIGHPGRFTHEVVFRRCERYRECSVVREGDFVRVFCGSGLPWAWRCPPVGLPSAWNVAP
jgi:hypothetical protein